MHQRIDFALRSSNQSLSGSQQKPNPTSYNDSVLCHHARLATKVDCANMIVQPLHKDHTMLIKFTNCKLTLNGKLVEKDLWIDSAKGVIVDPQKVFYDQLGMPDRIVNLGGKILAPGFIDIQINGAMGMDFSVPSADESYAKGVKIVNSALVKYGVTAYCPTLTSQTPDLYKNALPHLRPLGTRNPKDGSEILGAHVEGPFIHPGKRGIHSPAVFRTVSSGGFSDLEECYGSNDLKGLSSSIPPAIKIITGAPELPGMMSVIEECKHRNIVFSIGHSTAGIETAEEAVQTGATLITHLFNAMQQLHHRDPGVVGLLGSEDTLPRPYYGIICDGVHIHKSCVKLAYRSHPHGAILVTDAMAQLGLPNGTYSWTNGKRITKEGMYLHLENEKTIAGSAVTLDECVRNLVSWTSCSIAQAVDCVTAHPAKLLGITDKKGGLAPGMDADLVVLDEAGNVSQTWKFGEKVFDASERVIEHHVEQEVKRIKAPRKENEPIHGYSAFEPFLELAKVTSPTGVVRVH